MEMSDVLRYMKTEKVYIEFLVLQAQAGDDAAISKLLPLIHQKMLVYANRLLHGSVDAEDCVQDAMLVVVKGLRQLRQVKAFHGWLYKVIHTRCIDLIRKLPAGITFLDDVPEHVRCDSANEGVNPGIGCDNQFDVSKAIQNLTTTQQSVIYLFYFEGFTVVEISVILEKPAGTIKSHLFAARAAIKSFLNQE
jgi:RNA polymerase sigma-70 factor (ECF subfamily)